MKTSPVVSEYLALNSISAKLDFDPSGRPGANDVREDQKRLHLKMSVVRQRTRDNLKPAQIGAVIFSVGSGREASREDYYNYRHSFRQQKIDRFLQALADRKQDMAEGCPRELFGLPMEKTLPSKIRRLGGWWVRQVEDVSWDNNRYSKGWHRAHGGAKSVDDRRVEFRRMTGAGVESKTVHLSTWGGDWLARAVVEAGLAPVAPSQPLKIRLHAAYDAKYMYLKRGYTWYARTLIGEVVDYVIVSPLGMVYHDADRANLVKGLHAKIRGQSRKLGGLVDWALCKKLGFCDAGINAFCDAFGLDNRGSYSPAEIEQAVRRNPADAGPFLGELRTLADALNYRTSWEV